MNLLIIFLYVAPILLMIKVLNLFTGLLSIGIWIFNTILLLFYSDWHEEVASNTPKLSYRQFIALYDVMPDDFELRDYDIKYKDKYVDFASFPDYLRYRRFRKNIERYRTQQTQFQNQAALIRDLQCGLAQQQADIDYFVKEHIIK